MSAISEIGIGRGLGTDYLLLRSELTAQELDYLERTRRFVDEEVLPVMPGYWERAELPLDLARRLGELGLVGDGIEGYGCPPMTAVAAGLIQMELSRGDGSLGTLLGVQAGLAMRSIATFGDEQHKQRWLPQMARTGWSRCWPTSPQCSCTASESAEWTRTPSSKTRSPAWRR
jgi:glutaryl-CoA dehydrogenase